MKTKGRFFKCKYADEIIKSIFILITTILITAPLLDSMLISIAIAETFCALMFMPDLNKDIKNAKTINKIFNIIIPVILLFFIFVFNLENIKIIALASVISFIISFFTAQSISVFHSLGMFLFPITQFIAIEGSRGNLEMLFSNIKDVINTDCFIPMFLFYIASIGIFYGIFNVLFLLFKNKKIVFLISGIFSLIFSLLNTASVVLLNQAFSFKIIEELFNIFKSTTDWTAFLNTTILFNTSVITTIIFAVMYFPFVNALTSESNGPLIFKERIIRFLAGCVILVACVFTLNVVSTHLQAGKTAFPDFAASSIILNANSEKAVPLIN